MPRARARFVPVEALRFSDIKARWRRRLDWDAKGGSETARNGDALANSVFQIVKQVREQAETVRNRKQRDDIEGELKRAALLAYAHKRTKLAFGAIVLAGLALLMLWNSVVNYRHSIQASGAAFAQTRMFRFSESGLLSKEVKLSELIGTDEYLNHITDYVPVRVDTIVRRGWEAWDLRVRNRLAGPEPLIHASLGCLRSVGFDQSTVARLDRFTCAREPGGHPTMAVRSRRRPRRTAAITVVPWPVAAWRSMPGG